METFKIGFFEFVFIDKVHSGDQYALLNQTFILNLKGQTEILPVDIYNKTKKKALKVIMCYPSILAFEFSTFINIPSPSGIFSKIILWLPGLQNYNLVCLTGVWEQIGLLLSIMSNNATCPFWPTHTPGDMKCIV